MVNVKGRPKIRKDRNWSMTSFFIPETFEDIWNKIAVLAKVDDNDEFKEYCKDIEEINLDVKGSGKRGVYIRWVLTKHVHDNLDKLAQIGGS